MNKEQLNYMMERIISKNNWKWDELYYQIELNGGPSTATVKRLRNSETHNFNEKTLKGLSSALQRITETLDIKNDFKRIRTLNYPNIEKAINFLKEEEDKVILLSTEELKELIKEPMVVAFAYSLEDFLSYDQWIEYSAYNHNLLKPLTNFDFSPPNERLLRSFLDELNISIVYDHQYPNRISLNSNSYYGKIKFGAYLRIFEKTLWVSELHIIEPLELHAYTTIYKKICNVFEEYARFQGFDQIIISYSQYTSILDGIIVANAAKNMTSLDVTQYLIEVLDSLGYKLTNSGMYVESSVKYLI